MPRFKVTRSYEYIVEASSVEEAQELVVEDGAGAEKLPAFELDVLVEQLEEPAER